MEQTTQNTVPRSENRSAYITGIASFAAGFLLAWIFFGGNGTPGTAPTEDESSNTASVVDAMAAKNAIAAEDQAPGPRVIIKSLTIEKEGWVAIHEDRDGKPGNILGARKVAAGTVENFNVPLVRATKEGVTNYAMLHGEDGTEGFNYKTDAPLTDDTGNPVMAAFKATTQTTSKTQ